MAAVKSRGSQSATGGGLARSGPPLGRHEGRALLGTDLRPPSLSRTIKMGNAVTCKMCGSEQGKRPGGMESGEFDNDCYGSDDFWDLQALVGPGPAGSVRVGTHRLQTCRFCQGWE